MKNLFSKLSGLVRSTGSIGPNPGRDWLILLVGGALVFAASIGWNVWFFDQIVDEGIGASEVGEGTLDAYQAGAVKEIFGARATTSEAYRSVYPFIDPSR